MNRILSFILLSSLFLTGVAVSAPGSEGIKFYDCQGPTDSCEETFFDCQDFCDTQDINDVFYDCDDTQDLLFEAVTRAKNQKEIRRLIAAGANINFQDEEGLTPLMYAVIDGKIENCIALLQAGANPTITDNCGNTLLTLASEYQGKLFAKVFTAVLIKYCKK
jgi:hypothetical protein